MPLQNKSTERGAAASMNIGAAVISTTIRHPTSNPRRTAALLSRNSEARKSGKLAQMKTAPRAFTMPQAPAWVSQYGPRRRPRIGPS